MEKILREILADDKNILGRRNDLIAALDSKVPANLARDYAAVKKAINLGVAEKFAIGSNDKDVTKAQVVEILKASGLQDKRVNYVVNTFVNALDWDKPISNETVDHEETTTTVTFEQKNDSAATTTKQQADSSASWMNNSSDKDTQPEQPKKFFSERPKNIKPAESKSTPSPSQSSTPTPPSELPPQQQLQTKPENSDALIEQTNSKLSTIISEIKAQTENTSSQTGLSNRVDEIFTIKGRINRWRYFTKSLKLLVLFVIGLALAEYIIGVPFLIAALVGNAMLMIRRLHDLNHSGWFYLITFIPYVNIIFGLYLLFRKGTEGFNSYGPDPLRE